MSNKRGQSIFKLINSTSISANQHISKFALLLICPALLASCAQVMTPGGGKKDELPPKVLKYTPDSAKLNFSAKIIEIDFDEFITLKDLNNQLIISPPLAKSPDVSVKNKTLRIELDKNEVLKPNTTYSINFGTAVQDLNEGNPIENFSYIFSTGNFIDSLKLKGKVRNAFNQSTEKGILVMLYGDNSDSVVYKSTPDYFAKSNADGSFLITNIRSGKYKIVAIKDANGNFKYDGESESIGFMDVPIDLNSKDPVFLDVFQEPSKKTYLKKYIHDAYGKVSLFFNQGSDSLSVKALNNTDKGVQEYLDRSKNNDTLTYWFNNFQKDSLILQVSNGNSIMDTLSIQLIKRAEAEKSKKHPLKSRVVSSPDGNQSFDLGSELNIRMSNILSSGTAKMFEATLIEDTVSRPVIIEAYGSTLTAMMQGDSAFYEDTEDPFGALKKTAVYEALDKWKENTKYELLILPNSFTDFFGQANDSIKVKFKTKEEKYYGSVKLTLHLPPGRDYLYMLELQDEGGTTVRRWMARDEKEVIDFNFLAPKKYKLKLTKDMDYDNKWSTGNYLRHVQPDKVFYNAELINIRSNWDAELEWTVND